MGSWLLNWMFHNLSLSFSYSLTHTHTYTHTHTHTHTHTRMVRMMMQIGVWTQVRQLWRLERMTSPVLSPPSPWMTVRRAQQKGSTYSSSSLRWVVVCVCVCVCAHVHVRVHVHACLWMGSIVKHCQRHCFAEPWICQPWIKVCPFIVFVRGIWECVVLYTYCYD